ncbi:hypothetical protein SUGI_0651520 [Cryptomeria japonica]|nr:hypothetical protein SUGI_0651520 [Cryptomeria japonica]
MGPVCSPAPDPYPFFFHAQFRYQSWQIRVFPSIDLEEIREGMSSSIARSREAGSGIGRLSLCRACPSSTTLICLTLLPSKPSKVLLSPTMLRFLLCSLNDGDRRQATARH